MATINRSNAVKLIEGTDGRIFGVSFVKRITGEKRDGIFRLGKTVKKGLKGGTLGYNPKEKGLIMVYAMSGDPARDAAEPDESFRRAIPIDGLLSVTVDGQTFDVIPG